MNFCRSCGSKNLDTGGNCMNCGIYPQTITITPTPILTPSEIDRELLWNEIKQIKNELENLKNELLTHIAIGG